MNTDESTTTADWKCDQCFDTETIDRYGREIPCPYCTTRKTRRIKYRFTYKLITDGYPLEAGDQRDYEVFRSGRYIGMVGQCPLPGPVVDGPLIDGFSFRSADGKLAGEGRTRAEAIIASGIVASGVTTAL
jgi:DNA-directed RNA polymerase subunit RPC12/RpoP